MTSLRPTDSAPRVGEQGLFALLLNGAEADGATAGNLDEETANAWARYEQELRTIDKLVTWVALFPTVQSKTVRIRGGEVLVTDGPYAETKEQLGGFYIVRCDNHEDAERLAALMPCAPLGSVHVRRVSHYDVRPGL